MSKSVNDIGNNYIYFCHLDKYCIIPTYPESISDSMSASFTSTSSLGRSAPVQTYSYSGPRTVQIQLDLHRDMMNSMNEQIGNFDFTTLKSGVVDFRKDDYMDTLINYLQTVVVPNYKVSGTEAQGMEVPMVVAKFGSNIFIKGVVSGSTSVSYKKPLISDGQGGFKYASVTIQFPITEVDPYSASAVAQQGSFRGVTATFKNGIFADSDIPDNELHTEWIEDGSNSYSKDNNSTTTENNKIINSKLSTELKNTTVKTLGGRIPQLKNNARPTLV